MAFPSTTKALASTEPKVGDKMPDGTIYAGVSPNTGKAMYAAPDDVPLTLKWKEAIEYASKLKAHGHRDWRVPTKAELNELFNNRAAIGGFTLTGGREGWYWSSSPGGNFRACVQGFDHGIQNSGYEAAHFALRCVR